MKQTSSSHSLLVFFIVTLCVLPFSLGLIGGSWLRASCMALIFIMLALGLNVVVGFAGLLDLGYIAFFAVGAYLYALLASPHLWDNFTSIAGLLPNGLHVPIWAVIPLAALCAGLAGVILGAPTLKLRGDYLAIVTLGFGEIIRLLMQNLNAPLNFTNGPQGITQIDPVQIFNFSFGDEHTLGPLTLTPLHQYYFLLLVLVIISMLACQRLLDSRIGRAWLAIREDELAAKAMGLNTRNLKLLAFALGASFGGVAGAMFAALQGFISPESFVLNESILVLAMVVLGGIGHIRGVILGALLLAFLPEILRHTAEPIQKFLWHEVIVPAEVLRTLIYGLAMVLIMLYRPKGLWPSPLHGLRTQTRKKDLVAQEGQHA